MRGKKGSVAVLLTVFLMSFLLIVGVLAEAAAGKAARSYGDAVLGQAGRSVLSEYDRELQEAYGIFALRLSAEEIEERLAYYSGESFARESGGLLYLKTTAIQADLTEYSLLNTASFKAQILEYMKYRAPAALPGADKLVSVSSALFGLSDAGEAAEDAAEEFERAEKAKERAERRMESATEENAEERAAELAAAERDYERAQEQGRRQAEDVGEEAGSMEAEIRETEGILEALAGLASHKEDADPTETETETEGTPKGSRVLRNQAVIHDLPTRIMESPGGVAAIFDGLGSGELSATELRDSAYVNLYLMEKCHHHLAPGSQEDSFFANELEYILWGELADERNYSKTRNYLLALRTGLNLAHIYASPEKTELLAAAAATLLPGPGAPLMHFLLATAWAAGEAGMDMDRLEEGKRVPLWKIDADWQLSLESLLDGELSGTAQSTEEDRGLEYQGYLLLFLFLEPEEQKLLRLMDLIQLNLKGRYDESFSMGQCSGGFGFRAEVVRERSFLNIAGFRKTVYQEVHLY